MATLRNKRELAAFARDSQERTPRNSQSQNSTITRVNEEYITKKSEEIEGRLRKKLSQEFSRQKTGFLVLSSRSTISSESTSPVKFRNRSGNNPEHELRRQGTNRGSLPELSSSWSGCLRLPNRSAYGLITWGDILQQHIPWSKRKRWDSREYSWRGRWIFGSKNTFWPAITHSSQL